MSSAVIDLSAGVWTASIATTGATLRALTHHGRDVITTFPADGHPEWSQGATLAPWPNRLARGRYTVAGVTHQFPIADGAPWLIHGLVEQEDFDVVAQADDHVVLTSVIGPRPGWVATLRLDIAFLLDDAGLTVEVSAVNVGDVVAPFGYGAHPYLVVTDRNTATLSIPAARHLTVDADMLPVALAPVTGTPFDLRVPRALPDLDTAFTELTPDDDGLTRITLVDAGARTTVWMDPTCGWVQVFTPDDGTRVAVEPMTCGPDAFNHDGFGTMLLAPGDGVAFDWGISRHV